MAPSEKLLITPIVTPGLLEVDVKKAPDEFSFSIQNLLSMLSGKVDGVMFGGTTGEGHKLTIPQYRVLAAEVMRHKGAHNILAGLLGKQEILADQLDIATDLGITTLVLAINHFGLAANPKRIETVLPRLKPGQKVYLYDMPGGHEADIDLIREFADHPAVIGIKDSSCNPRHMQDLLELASDFFTVLHGSEDGYRDLSPGDRSKIAGLVSGTSGLTAEAPDILRRFMLDPNAINDTARAEVGKIITHAQAVDASGKGGGIRTFIRSGKMKLHLAGVIKGDNATETYGDENEPFFTSN